MKNPLDPSLRELDDCGCCAGTSVQTPAATDNRPGLPWVHFRAGVHSQFKATLLAGLSLHKLPALRSLHARENDDFTIALLDAFACTADVLTFYSERIANEAYLRTATERRSVLELARAIGYELAPGVAAQVMLAFTVEGGRGAPGVATIPKGTKVQSIPGPGEQPQTFETSLEFTGRAAWNELRPRLRAAPPQPSNIPDARHLFLAGTSTNLKRGDVLVLSSGPAVQAKRIVEMTVDRERGHTYVKFATTDGTMATPMPGNSTVNALASASMHLGSRPTEEIVGDLFLNGGISSIELSAIGHFHDWDVSKVQRHLNSLPQVTLFEANAGVFAMRVRASFFGHNAPRWLALPEAMRGTGHAFPKDWDDLKNIVGVSVDPSCIWQDSQGNDLNPPLNAAPNPQFDVLIERPMAEVVRDGWLVLETENSALVPLRVGRNSEVSRADFAMSAKCARLNLKNIDGETNPTKETSYTTRGTTAHVQSEPLDVVGDPIETGLTPGQTTLDLDRIDANLTVGQVLALKGEDADLPGTTQAEMIVVAAIHHGDVTTLTLKAGLQHKYRRATVSLNANVVPATHGDSTREVLGSGDAAQVFQRFTLKQQPLTYAFPLDAARPDSSLEIWVDDVKWREVANFYECGPKDRVYVVRHADDAAATVEFGDGQRGARLPTGRENVRAVYRKGIGVVGLVKEEQINLMLTQPLGVKGVTNPLAPRGAEDPQSLFDARLNAPRTVLTLNRVVSLQDYEDFARDFPGVDKAHAIWIWSGQTRGVMLTLLGPGGVAIGPSGQPVEPLRTALARQGIARVPVSVVTRPPSLLSISGRVRVDAERATSKVESEVKAALRANFSFAAREFGQGVARSEVVATIQNVAGVAFVEITGFQKRSLNDTGIAVTTAAEQGYLAAHKPANGTSWLLARPAELLMLDELSLTQLEVTSR